MPFKIEYKTYLLKHQHMFRISRGARSITPILLIKLQYDGINGYGEASMPPLYGETQDSAIVFLKKIDLRQFKEPFDIDKIMDYLDFVDQKNTAIKAAIDIALHDIVSKIKGITCYEYLGLQSKESIYTSKTIGIDKPEVIKQRVQAVRDFKTLKIKLGTRDDKDIIRAVREVSNQPLYIDVNQAWKNKYTALEKIKWLQDQNVLLIEQPMPVNYKKELAWLKERSPLPIIGDEGIQRLDDMENAEDFYHGINIKLVKSTGLNEAMKMQKIARKKNMQLMIGCMAETSCCISAAFQLASLADYVDLDGNLGIINDPFIGISTIEGKLINNLKPGIGLIKPEKAWNIL